MSQATLSDPATWVDQHGNYLFGYAMTMLRDRTQAEEAVQETFVSALKARDSFSGRSSEKTWLTGILKHKIMDHFRKVGRERPVGDDIEAEPDGASPFAPDGSWADPPAEWASPQASLEKKEFWEALDQCLVDLPENARQPFMLREMEGVDSEEICKVLGITPTNLWVRLHRARAGLRKCLETNWFGKEGGEE